MRDIFTFVYVCVWEGDLCFDHRRLYRALVGKRGPVGVYGVGQQG